MRKLLLNLTVCLTIISSAIPVSACTFNFYIDRSKDKIKQLLASETSNIIKSLVMSNQLNSDTKQTIDDMFGQEGQNNIFNQTGGGTLINNWGDFAKYWGEDGQISNNGFDQDKFIIANGKGTLTQQINSKTSLDNSLDLFKYSSSLNIITNSLVYDNILGPNASLKSKVINFLTMLQSPDQLPDNIKTFWPLINNLVNNYQNSFLTPINNLLNDLVIGWNDVPTKIDDLKTYMEQFKDGSQPYSQWVDATGTWTLDGSISKVASWTTQDYVNYRGGVFLNYLFKKIGNESNGAVPSKYLGTIINDNIDNTDNLLPALQPYFDALTHSPAYILMLIESFLPIIKQTVLQMPDITSGIEHLTIGGGYPTNKGIKSWNLLDLFTTLKNLLNNPDQISEVISNLLDSSFLYDVQIKAFKADIPLPLGLDLKPGAKKDITKKLTDLLTGGKVQTIFNSIYDLINKLNNEFPSGGIDINLSQLKELLIGKSGIFIQFITVAEKLAVIIKNKHIIQDSELAILYESLGGVIPTSGQSAGDNFVENSILDLLKKQFTQATSPLLSILSLLYNSDGSHKGIAQLLMDNNKKWIQDNYLTYFDIKNQNTSFSDINFTESTINNFDTINLDYSFTFKIKDLTYTFYIKGISKNDNATFRGTHNFKFTEIDLIH